MCKIAILTFVDDLRIVGLHIFSRNLNTAVEIFDFLDGRIETNVETFSQCNRYTRIAIQNWNEKNK